MTEHEDDTQEKPTPTGDDAVPDSDQIEDDQAPGSEDTAPVEDPSQGQGTDS